MLPRPWAPKVQGGGAKGQVAGGIGGRWGGGGGLVLPLAGVPWPFPGGPGWDIINF
jgi:hypothetical protein